jgi:hypothetical protein
MGDKTPIDACPVPEGWQLDGGPLTPKEPSGAEIARASSITRHTVMSREEILARWPGAKLPPSEAVSDTDVAEQVRDLRGDRGAEFDPQGHNE